MLSSSSGTPTPFPFQKKIIILSLALTSCEKKKELSGKKEKSRWVTDFTLTLRTSLKIILQMDKLNPKIVTHLC